MQANDKRVNWELDAARRLARTAFSVGVAMLLAPIFCLASVAWALYQRTVYGKASSILHSRQGPYRSGIFYRCQMVFAKPFEHSRFQQVFFEMVGEAGIEAAKALLSFEMEVPRSFPTSFAIEADYYVEQGVNWTAQSKHLRKMVLWIRVFNGQQGMPTVIQAGLPGSAWDGSSCFNFMKELVARSCGESRADIFQGKRLRLRTESARTLKESSFWSFLIRLPLEVALNTWSLIWNVTGTPRSLGGRGLGPETTLLNFSEADSARLEAGARAVGVKPFALLAFAAVNAYRAVLHKNPYCLLQQASLQARHYEPQLARNVVGDWLIGVVQPLSRDLLTLEDAQKIYQRLVGNLDTLGEEVRRAFDAKAYALVSGAAVFQAAPTYGLTTKIWDSIWFNNYGVRSVCTQADFISWNWAAPFGLGFNTIQVNGRTCVSLSSSVLGLDALQAMRDHVKATLRDFMMTGAARLASAATDVGD
jgi:hypothetical protein